MTDFAFDADQLSTGLISVDANQQITQCNQAACTYFGKTRMGLVGSIIGTLLPQSVLALIQDRARQQTIQISEVELAAEKQSVDIGITHLDSNHTLIEIHPVTERIRQRAHADRIDQQQAIAQLARQLAHEVRNPLAGIKAAAQLIEQQSIDASATRHADIINRGTERIISLLERFAQDQAQQKSPTHLHQLLQETADLVSVEQQGQLTINPDFDPSIPLLWADQDQLNQLFLNLMRNSAQARASLIRITTRIEHNSPVIEPPARHAIRVEIRDNGDGVPEHLRQRLFLPLVSGREHGSGFGLAVAQQIARAHGGLIEYEPGDQTTAFILRLPLLVADEPGVAHAQ
jgi:two-component system nitrogen regulation sensor histidine kinase GlnL